MYTLKIRRNLGYIVKKMGKTFFRELRIIKNQQFSFKKIFARSVNCSTLLAHGLSRSAQARPGRKQSHCGITP
jgi:hypothetical protein